MKRLRTAALIILHFALPTAMAQIPSEKRQLTLELDEAPGATAYEIEVQPTDRGTENKKYTFNSNTAKFVINLRPGRFSMRARVADVRGVFGPWSETTPISVTPRPPSPLWPENGKALKQKDHPKVNFRWNEVPGCDSYRLTVFDQVSGSIVSTLSTQKTHLETELPPGRTYRWTVQSLTQPDLLSELGDEQNQFTYVGAPLARPEFKNFQIDKVVIEAKQPTKSIHFEIRKEEAQGQMNLFNQGELTPGSQLAYQLEEQVLYQVQAVAQNPLFETSLPQVTYFERFRQEIVVYGESRPSAYQRRQNKTVRWSALIKTISPTFEGQNNQSERKTYVEGSQGLGASFGVSRLGQSFLSRADVNYSRLSVSSLSTEVTVGLFQLNYSALWLRNFGWKRVPIRLQFGGGYDESAEFIGYEDGHFDVHFLRALGPSIGIESGVIFSQRQNLVLGFKLTLPMVALHVPQGKMEKGSRANLSLHYFHDLRFFTGIVGIEIQGQDFTYGDDANQFNLSTGGISLGIMY